MSERSAKNEYMAKYMLARYHRRRAEAVARLGSRCGMCGSTTDLEIDHRDPKTKAFDLGKAFAGFSEARIAEELAKCWLLCGDCHMQKTNVEIAVKVGRRIRWQHGTLGGYRHCKCALCREAKADANRSYKAAQRA